jgi:hypothetical protein
MGNSQTVIKENANQPITPASGRKLTINVAKPIVFYSVIVILVVIVLLVFFLLILEASSR